MANKRITDVDFLDSLNSNESFFVNQNNAIKQVSKSNIVFDIINGGTGAVNASDALENLGAAPSSHTHNATDIIDGTLNSNCLPTIEMDKGGTGATDGATGLKNLLASGITVLSEYQYGDELPDAGTVGRIFFKKV